MKKTIKKDNQSGSINRSPDSIENLQQTIFDLKKENAELREKNMAFTKENAKLHKLLVESKVKLISQKNEIAALEKVLPEAIRSITLEDKLRQIREERAKRK